LELGPETRLLVDCTLGEVYGPCVMGPMEPKRKTLVRPMSEIVRVCQERGVACEPKSVGHFPTWPENLRGARCRFARRFLTYLRRSIRVRRNFIIVSHADCVGAALSMMPSEVDSMLEKVEFGGMFVAQRMLGQPPAQLTMQPESPARSSTERFDPNARPRHDTSSGNTMPDSNGGVEAGPFMARAKSLEAIEADEAMVAPDSEPPTVFFNAGPGDTEEMQSPQASDGWKVQTYGCKQVPTTDCLGNGVLEQRLKDIVDDDVLSLQMIEELLVERVAGLPLGESSEVMSESVPQRKKLELSRSVSLTNSTLLFGASRADGDGSKFYSWSTRKSASGREGARRTLTGDLVNSSRNTTSTSTSNFTQMSRVTHVHSEDPNKQERKEENQAAWQLSQMTESSESASSQPFNLSSITNSLLARRRKSVN